MSQARIFQLSRRYEMGDYSRNLYEVVTDFKNQVIRVPSFQREFCWPDAKRIAFVNRLMDGKKPIGVIALYELEKDNSHVVWLNDGLQRLSTCLELLSNSTKFGVTQDQAIDILKAYSFAIQHRSYDSHDEAVSDYKDINKGTPLTSYEFYKGDLSNIPDFDVAWSNRLDNLHNGIYQRLLVVCVRPADVRMVEHKYLRHDFALFYRYATVDKTLRSYDVNKSAPSDRLTNIKARSIEWLIRQWLLDNGPVKYDAVLEKFLRMIENETAIIETEWRKIDPNPGKKIMPTLWRWLMDVAIWRRNNDKRTIDWIDFVSRMLRYTEGVQRFQMVNGKNNPLILGDLQRLRVVSATLGSTLYDSDAKPNYTRPANIAHGYDISHEKPHALFGDGPSIVEPATPNRSRGAAPIHPLDTALSP